MGEALSETQPKSIVKLQSNQLTAQAGRIVAEATCVLYKTAPVQPSRGILAVSLAVATAAPVCGGCAGEGCVCVLYAPSALQ